MFYQPQLKLIFPKLFKFQNVLGETLKQTQNTHGSRLHFNNLVNGYKTFDLSRGLDYKLDLNFTDTGTNEQRVKRFLVAKPLGKVDFVTVPYVTENSRVVVFLTVQESETVEAMEFLNEYVKNIMNRREKVILMLAFLYQLESPSKGADDPFRELKEFALETSERHRSEDTRIVWISIRIPVNTDGNDNKVFVRMEDFPAMNFAVVDLSLRKIGLETIVLVVDPFVVLSVDFLNRVRMNTIMGFQIFSPIPFRQYDPKISGTATLDVHKDVGHFDRDEYKFISFYGRDYVRARKAAKGLIPIVRADADIERVLTEDAKVKGNLFEMFLERGRRLHCFRATDMSLLVKHRSMRTDGRRRIFAGTKAQIAAYLKETDGKFKAEFGNE